jgi:hypothetical protein
MNKTKSIAFIVMCAMSLVQMCLIFKAAALLYSLLYGI